MEQLQFNNGHIFFGKFRDFFESTSYIKVVNELDTNQRIKMLHVTLQYTLPKLKLEVDEVKDVPLFID